MGRVWWLESSRPRGLGPLRIVSDRGLACPRPQGATCLLKLTSWRRPAHPMSHALSLRLPIHDAGKSNSSISHTAACILHSGFCLWPRAVDPRTRPICTSRRRHWTELSGSGIVQCCMEALLNPKKLEAFIREKLSGSQYELLR